MGGILSEFFFFLKKSTEKQNRHWHVEEKKSGTL